jgi:hypothetical protein
MRRASTVPYVRKGMFYSEVFLFLRACQRFGVDFIVESGVRDGMSTALLSACFDGEIVSIDREATLSRWDRVRVIRGDALLIVPSIVAESQGRRMGILLDGPKGPVACGLKTDCLHAPHVCVVALHDQPRGHGEQWHSHDPLLQQLTAGLDTLVTEDYRQKYPLGPGLAGWEQTCVR